MTQQPQALPEDDPAPDSYPTLMIYTTTRLSSRGGWSMNVRIATPDGRETISATSRAGGSVDVGHRKVVKDLDDAYSIAVEHLDPFPDEVDPGQARIRA
jgi:hypothetical protein